MKGTEKRNGFKEIPAKGVLLQLHLNVKLSATLCWRTIRKYNDEQIDKATVDFYQQLLDNYDTFVLVPSDKSKKPFHCYHSRSDREVFIQRTFKNLFTWEIFIKGMGLFLGSAKQG